MRQRVALALVALVTLLPRASTARALDVETVDLAARIDAANGRVAGVERIVVGVGEGDHELRLWLWADRLAVAPTGMDERTWRAIYPGEVALGGAQIERVEVDGARAAIAPCGTAPRDVAGTTWRLPIPPGASREVTVVVHFRIDVPVRFGRLGRIDDVLSMAGPWMPIVVDEQGGWDSRAHWRVSIETMDARDVAIGDAVGRSWRGRPVFAEAVQNAYVALLIAPHLVTIDRETGTPCAVRLVMRDPAPSSTLSDLVDSGRGSLDPAAIDRVVAVTGEVCRTLVAAGLGSLVSADPIPVLVVPSRTELASTAGDVVTVSDRAYRVSHIDALLDFHDRAVRTALFRTRVRALSTPSSSRDRPIEDDVRAAILADEDDARRNGHAQTPDELLGFAAFHPTVDQLLYAPQVPFADAYFGYVEEDDRFRDDPRASLAPLPHGTRLLRDLRATLSPAAYRTALRTLLHVDCSSTPTQPCEASAWRSVFTQLDSWVLAPSHHSDFRLGQVTSVQEGGRWVHHVEVLRRGATSGDPIVVELDDAAGHRVRGTWAGEGPRGQVVLRTAAPLAAVRIDPDGNVPQTAAFAGGHPRTDDASGQPWRLPLIAGFEVSYSAAEQRVDALVDFALHQRFDLDHTVGVRLQTGARSAGGTLRYIQGMGPLRDLNGRIGSLSAGLDLQRLRTDFSPTAAEGAGAWSGALVASAAIDTRVFRNDWRYGYSLVASVRASATLHDDATLHGALSGSLRGTITSPIGLRNAVMLVVGAGMSLGDPVPAELQSLGGLYTLRGFATNELLGRGRVYAVVEHRATVLADLSWSIFDLVYVREIQLAFFAGAGVLFAPLGRISRNLDPSVDAHFAADAGVGVRFHYLYGGVQPGVMAIDFATPIVSSHYGNEGLRIAAYVSFDQYF